MMLLLRARREPRPRPLLKKCERGVDVWMGTYRTACQWPSKSAIKNSRRSFLLRGGSFTKLSARSGPELCHQALHAKTARSEKC